MIRGLQAVAPLIRGSCQPRSFLSRGYAVALPEVRKELKSDPERGSLPDDPLAIPFGTSFSDHMLLMDWTEKSGWNDPRIVPFGPFNMHPASTILHYGQEVFEGMKAHTTVDGRTTIFRPDKNMERMHNSCERLCLPTIPHDVGIHLIDELIRVDHQFVPKVRGASLYIRPTVIGVEPCLGVKPAGHVLFFIIMCPVGSYYGGTGIKPIKIWICDKYTRAAPLGIGEAKTAGNYAASLKGGQEALKYGCQQAMWLDGAEHKYVEEVGAMNMFFVFKRGNGVELVTPELNGSILPGVTRDSIIQLAPSLGEDWSMTVRKLPLEELLRGVEDGTCVEAFGAGTAAVVAPVSHFHWQGKDYQVGNGDVGDVAQTIYGRLQEFYYGSGKDDRGWVHEVK